MTATESAAISLVHRIGQAMSARDLDAMVDCFAADYRLETPAHPARDFVGADQVRRNQSILFDAIPDLEARIIRVVADGDTAWTEWEWTGTRRDGSAHRMRGVVITGERDGRAAWARFYMEPVEQGGVDVERAVALQTVAGVSPTGHVGSQIAEGAPR